MRKSFFRPKIRLYTPPGDCVIKPSDNPLERFAWLTSHKAKPSKFKQGDVCIVTSGKLKGRTVRVHYASGNHIECRLGNLQIVLKESDLRWVRYSRV
jgi:hypothetical protein